MKLLFYSYNKINILLLILLLYIIYFYDNIIYIYIYINNNYYNKVYLKYTWMGMHILNIKYVLTYLLFHIDKYNNR